MINIEEILYKLHKYGSYAVPFYNYIIEEYKNEEIAIFLQIALLRKNNKHEEAIYVINNDLKFVKNKNIYYLLMGMKMQSLFLIKNNDYIVTYKILKRKLSKIPQLAREILKPVFLTIESSTNYFYDSRFWGETIKKDNYLFSFFLIGVSKKEKNVIKKRNILTDSIMLAKKIPNPSLIISALDNLQKTYEKNCKMKRTLSYLSYYYASYYLDNFYEISKKMEKYIELYQNINIYKYINELEIYKRINIDNDLIIKSNISEIIQKMDLNKKKYELNNEIVNFLNCISEGNISKFCKENSISRTTFYSILERKILYIKSSTIRKILKNNKNIYEMPIEFKMEYFKEYLDVEIEKFYYKIKNKSEKTVFNELLSTYLAFPKVYSKSKKHYDMIMNIKKYSLKDIKNLNNNYKLFLIQNFSENISIFIKARKDLIFKSNKEFDYESLKKAFTKYLSYSRKERELIEKFLMSLERYKKLPTLKKSKYYINMENNVITDKKYINALYYFNKKDRNIIYKLLLKNINFANK